MAPTFGATSTADEVLRGVDLIGRRVLVTGVSAGIGVETACVLAARGAQVVGTARDLGKARVAKAHVGANAAVKGSFRLELDLASLASVWACADALLAAGGGFAAVIGNAGVMAAPEETTVVGFDTQFGTNHLGHFVLVSRVADLFRPGVTRAVTWLAAVRGEAGMHRLGAILNEQVWQTAEWQHG